MGNNRKPIQLYRNTSIVFPGGNKSALENSLQMFNQITDPKDGELVLVRYKEDGHDIRTVVGIYYKDNQNQSWTFLFEQEEFARKPLVLYETDGTSGLLGVNSNELGYNWQLSGYNFTPYKFLRCYIKVADYNIENNRLTPAMVIDLPLDNASMAQVNRASGLDSGTGKPPCDMYIAGGTAVSPSDQNQIFTVLCAVDSTKTKFQVVCENRIYGTAQVNVNDGGRFLYKIEGCYD